VVFGWHSSGGLVNRPVILLVSDQQRVLTTLAADLRRRFGADYQVSAVGSAAAALAAVAAASRREAEVALVIADQSMGGVPAVELLARAHVMAPTAKRVLLIGRGDWSSDHPVVSAMALGQVDYHLFNPWRPLERALYPAVSELLAAWDKSQDAQQVPVRIVGAESSAGSHVVRDALTRVGVPYWFYHRASEAGKQLLADAAADGTRLPVLVFYQGTVLVDPPLAEVWQALGLKTHLDIDSCDLAVIGGGPAGLAAAVYAASEGLATVVLESAVPGGQAGTSSLIRNYLGFNRGISGDDFATRAAEQAWLFGARFVLSQQATRLRTSGHRVIVTTGDGREVTARAAVVATGVSWRRLGVPTLEALVGAGVFYGAAGAEARAMQGQEVYVVGGGNSAGQAAMHLAKYAARVTMLIRGESLAANMSTYLVSEIEHAPNISIRLGAEVVDGAGAGRLETITVRRRNNSVVDVVPASALFLLIGAEPLTGWLHGCVARNEKGFILTGQQLLNPGSPEPPWPLQRPPMLLETSMPGVFAAGDVRHRSIKRVAAAVGEGSTAIQLIHDYLSDSDA
jgi:thioredoxin reductase (NADPH)